MENKSGNSHEEQNLDKTIDENMSEELLQQKNTQDGVVKKKVTGSVNPYTQISKTSTPLSGPMPPSDLPDGSEPLPLGSGVIANMLGEGGMARVYKIWNEQLEVFRAVKVFLSTGQPESRKRFETEIKISAKLHHPNIIETYSVGEWNELPYIEMELVEGVSLEDFIEQYGKLPLKVCVAIGIQVSKALNYAHNQEFLLYGKTYKGIIHRDLKPANIMLSNTGIVKMLDFGIARPTEVGLHTVAGNIVGTLPYLSPEQLDDKNIDQRSDIYSLGTILYESLTGEKTFPQDTVTSLMKMKVINQYRKFDSFTIKSNPQLEKVIEKCLSQSKTQRYTTANELEAALSAVYRKLTSEPPEDILNRFANNPDEFADSNKKAGKKIAFPKLPKISSKKSELTNYLYIIGSSVLGTVVLIVALLFLFRSDSTEETDLAAASDTVAAVPTFDPLYHPDPQDDKEGDSEQDATEEPGGRPEPSSPRGAEPSTPEPTPTRPSTPTPPPPSPPPPPRVSPLDQLKEKYNNDDLVAVGIAAAQSYQFQDAIKALEAVNENNPGFQNGQIYLAMAYVETNQLAKASAVLNRVTSRDGFVALLRGRVAYNQGKDREAISILGQALTSPSSIIGAREIRSDALYYTALARERIHKNNPSGESRRNAMAAWNSVKQFYPSDHARFRTANERLSGL
ncbi:protein kinase [Chitinispirillales bacterium ANBcel5]|uniref:protein kinase domain-containing protein n=1 Tax=Cellulosispirillum alkaliphilum TaxID=3039283 RepID=UPI002A58F545|nr:protein kinase [Chitinispirillales bacterium ANBcel5]